VRMYRVTGSTVTVEGEADLGLPQDTYVRDWEWPDASALVILVSDGTLLKFDGKAVTKIARPAKKLFKTKKSGDGPVNRDERLIATATGEIWLDHCGYAYQGDDDPCSSNVYVRIAPAPAKATPTEPTARPAPATPAVPTDWSFSIQPAPVATSDGPAEPNPYGALTCAGPGGAHATLPIADGSAGFSIEDAEVVSTQPMIQVVNDWYAGEADMMPMGHLLAGCTVLTEVEYPTVERSASGYWTVAQTRFDAPGGDVILAWQGRIVTELADVSSVSFAPSASARALRTCAIRSRIALRASSGAWIQAWRPSPSTQPVTHSKPSQSINSSAEPSSFIVTSPTGQLAPIRVTASGDRWIRTFTASADGT
jgi:hypothetical protein